jgi:hypothetical protein
MAWLMGWTHALGFAAWSRLAGERGQGTVEYVGLILLMAGVLAAVVAFGRNGIDGKEIGSAIVDKVTEAIGTASEGKG